MFDSQRAVVSFIFWERLQTFPLKSARSGWIPCTCSVESFIGADCLSVFHIHVFLLNYSCFTLNVAYDPWCPCCLVHHHLAMCHGLSLPCRYRSCLEKDWWGPWHISWTCKPTWHAEIPVVARSSFKVVVVVTSPWPRRFLMVNTKGNHRGMDWEFMIFMDIYIYIHIYVYIYIYLCIQYMYVCIYLSLSIYAKWFGKDQSTSYSSSASYLVIWKWLGLGQI